MKQLLILCRHGNTFEDGQKVVMVGAKEDLPLTEKGRSQAAAVGEVFKRHALALQAIYTGPLKRTRESAHSIAAIAAQELQPIVEPRLTELEYGEWGGLSDNQIAARWGAQVLEDWHIRGIRPRAVTFTPSEDQLERDARAMLDDFAGLQGLTLVVTSNGRLRQFGRVISNDTSRSWKVGTGRTCVIERSGGRWSIVGWDCTPEQLEKILL